MQLSIIDKFNKKLIEIKNPLDFIFKDGTKRLTFISHFRKVILDSSGFRIKSIEQKLAFYGLSWDGELGIEDPRIIKINNLYVMTYVGLSRTENISTYLAISNDCNKWYRKGIIFEEQNKDAVIFQELINNQYVALNRPEGSFEFSQPHIWISYSKNLETWGKPKPLILSKNGWDAGRVGAGPPPIKTEKGWVLLYHAVNEKQVRRFSLLGKIKEILGIKEKRIIYNIGAVLLDLKNPSKIITKTKTPLFIPTKKHEKGSIENKDVIFPTGIVPGLNNKDILIYSGAGDVVTTVKKVSLKDIFKKLSK